MSELWGFDPIHDFLCTSLLCSPPFPAFSVSIAVSDMVVSFLPSATKRLWATKTQGSLWQGRGTRITKQGQFHGSFLNCCRDSFAIICSWSNVTLNLQSILTWESKSSNAEQVQVRAGGDVPKYVQTQVLAASTTFRKCIYFKPWFYGALKSWKCILWQPSLKLGSAHLLQTFWWQ